LPKRFRLTRRFPVAMTEDGYRRLKKFSAEAGLDEGEALSFLFENFSSPRPIPCPLMIAPPLPSASPVSSVLLSPATRRKLSMSSRPA